MQDAIANAQNPRANKEELAKLSQNPNPTVRQFVAKHLNTSGQTLSNLIDDPFEEVLVNLAKNINLSKECLQKLTKSKNPNISNVAKFQYNLMFGNFLITKNNTESQNNLKAIQYLESQEELTYRQKRLLVNLRTIKS